MEITLTDAEKLVLRETVEKATHEMLMEIANTDNRKMRDGLKAREGILKHDPCEASGRGTHSGMSAPPS